MLLTLLSSIYLYNFLKQGKLSFYFILTGQQEQVILMLQKSVGEPGNYLYSLLSAKDFPKEPKSSV